MIAIICIIFWLWFVTQTNLIAGLSLLILGALSQIFYTLFIEKK